MSLNNQDILTLTSAKKFIVSLFRFTPTIVITLLVVSQSSWSYLSSSTSLTSPISSPLASPIPDSSKRLTNEEKTEIENFLQHSNTVHDIVQDEVADSLDRFTAILGLSGALVVLAGTYWARKTMKEQLQLVKEEMKSEFQVEFHDKSLKLTDATSGLLGLVVSMENIKFLSDLSFNPISTESRQAIEHYPDVLKNFKEHFKLQTLPAGFHVKLGDVLSLLGRYQLIEADSNHDEDAREEAMQKFNNAISAYDEAINSKPKEIAPIDRRFWAEVFCKRGNSFAGLGEYNRAIADYRDALAINQDCYWAIHSQGDARSSLGEYEEAIRKYNEALKVSKIPETWYAETLYKKGITYAKQLKYHQAKNCYEDSLKFNPKNSWVLHSLGDSLTSLEEYEQAVEKYEEALAANPRQYQTWRALGDVLYLMGGHLSYEKALEKYERASEIASEDGVGDYEIHRKIGDTYLRLGEYFDAVRHYDEAVSLKSESFRLWACRAYANEQILKLDVLSEEEKDEYEQKVLSDRNIALHKVTDKHHRFSRNHKNHDIEKGDFFYERAICYALANDKNRAIQDLVQAISQDEKYIKWASREIGFITIQSDFEFKNLMEKSYHLSTVGTSGLNSTESSNAV
ncbi:tetratricopeptide repeat protein [Alkalinema sp. FACHB-956]|uniref:tetratricopeptide repeat protein n=1 Tax=Alkalinema sp. FACHB-956 TaxID=2692768 RepID=UPI00168981C7|nr:tetratricopeptide repeat protein [Alkalinema sp. FACHB-956]MBD2325826.1 tetratricopeptide repeat protein [Alkalinema sp. FACHB-956]